MSRRPIVEVVAGVGGLVGGLIGGVRVVEVNDGGGGDVMVVL